MYFFREIELKWVRSFPYFWPHIKFNPQLVVLEKIRPILDHHRSKFVSDVIFEV